jgi:hypothetical protein
MDVAFGDGLAHYSSDTLRGRDQNGIDFIWDFGLTLSPRVRAGIGVNQWMSSWSAGKNTWLTSFALLVYYYPLARRTFFLQAGVGSANYSVVHDAGFFSERADSVFVSGTAWGVTVAAGWDAPLHGVISLRPRLAYSYGFPRRLHSPDGTLMATGWKQNLLSLDLGVVVHPKDSW